ncbi:Polymyxin resistance protein ArnT, undecaprenyl phosphate-alpha-L-Ara4N transferase [Grimontia indica]|uniref:Polymyxin resistance protein ArnT, undecaprenyl phosphate-alpha-L-Ara4N transferase n=1 Tax=Grimontia indica TaxID=1056512 RepID=R1GNG9_9GAMM|nr:glycosyltransferase family 39 protein [Grimontia indica]EOD77649.1 Polymyxin resistance protein ArnT, undecaprenyl phosphate-alpha-L-Ara4N transferase [Grimontia indica]
MKTLFNKLSSLSLWQLAIAMIAVSLIVRFASLAMYPLMDTTEARYGEMARIMFETQNWVTPMFDYDVPFWGKPPLFTWLSAGGIALFGNNEFAVRLPHLIVGMGIIGLVYLFAIKAGKSRSEAALAAAVLASCAIFIVISGAVMTDTALTLGITTSMASYWLALERQSKTAGYLFFVGLAIGLLAKGPLTLVLVGISLGLWICIGGRWLQPFRMLPWRSGLPLMLAIALPWYLIAEWQTPGFLNYFLIGEHFMRFVVSGWEGDLYGTAHNEARGTIWLFAILAALPWTPVFFYQLFRRFRAGSESISNNYIQFLWCWMLAPLLLFTFAGNILSSYVMPGIPAFALLIAAYQSEKPLTSKVYLTGFITPALIMGAATALSLGVTGKTGENSLMSLWQKQPEAQFSDLYYVGHRPFSAQYYSDGKARKAQGELAVTIEGLNQPAFIVHSTKEVNVFDNCEKRGNSEKRVLIYCTPDNG